MVTQWLLRWPMQWLGLLLLAVCCWVVLYTYQSSKRMVLEYARDSAQTHAESITQFRNFYAEELVPRAVRGGLQITHDYKAHDHALPLPATLTIELGHYLSRVDGGTQVRLYSDLPFPWRERQLDDFQQQALNHLRINPDKPFVREEIVQGTRVLRYAQADRMLARCVACHNSYPGSPRTDWKVGDVRGALEVELPVSQWQLASTEVLNRTFFVLLGLLFCGLALVWFSVRRIRLALQTAHQLSDEREQANRQLSEEIVERKLAERHLQLSESKLSTIFKSVPEAIVVADAQGRIIQCNEATAQIFGHTLDELMGQKINLLMTASDAADHDSHIGTYLSTGHKRLMNQPRLVTGRRKDGSAFPVWLTISEARVDNAHVFIGVMQDFTAVQQTQDQLVEAKEKAEQANRIRGEFLANMSHEIRTPMNGIVGMIDLSLGTDDAAVQREYLGLARDSAHHLLHIINEILDFSKIEARALELHWVAVSPAQLIRHTVRSLEQLAVAKGLRLELQQDAALPELVLLDPVRVRQVLTNLVGNAIKFTREGHVQVQTRLLPAAGHQTQERLCIRIEDTGIGFDPRRADALFSPFTQADGSVTRVFGGTGLGLAITRSLVQLMGGQVTAVSQPGQGACFTVELPVRPVPMGPELPLSSYREAQAPVSQGRTGLSILLVEDHDINLKLAEIMLGRMGHRHVAVRDGQQALDRLAHEHFDVVLMDVMMPVMDGLTALRLLRERERQQGRHTPVLMVTAYAMTGDRERFMAAGADGYVSKPLSQTDLQKEIDRLMGHAAPEA